jgi:hypothetical protein
MALMDLAQAAAEIGASERWLADNLRAGRFPAKKIGRRWKLSDDDISAILQICSVNHASVFSVDSSVGVSPSSSMTKTTARRLQQSSHPP